MSETTRASGIEIVRDPDRADLQRRGVFLWDVWTKEPSRFPWTYDDREVCYFLEGDVVVTPEGGEPVRMGAGDLVTFPAGMRCTWEVRAAVRKHFSFGGGGEEADGDRAAGAAILDRGEPA